MTFAAARRIIAFAGAATLLSSCNPFDPILYTACEDALKARLKSPSSYERISINLTKHETDEIGYFVNRDMMDQERRAIRRKAWEHRPAEFVNFAVNISYDAQNGFGALLRGSATCNYFSDDGTYDDASQYTVKVNGKTQLEWLKQASNP